MQRLHSWMILVSFRGGEVGKACSEVTPVHALCIAIALSHAIPLRSYAGVLAEYSHMSLSACVALVCLAQHPAGG